MYAHFSISYIEASVVIWIPLKYGSPFGRFFPHKGCAILGVHVGPPFWEIPCFCKSEPTAFSQKLAVEESSKANQFDAIYCSHFRT